MAVNGVRGRTRDREKQCAFCERTFTKEEHLKRHQRTHTGEKPFKCHKCHRQYGRSDVLARHLQTHSVTEKSESRRQPENPEGDTVEVQPSTAFGRAISNAMVVEVEGVSQCDFPNDRSVKVLANGYHQPIRNLQGPEIPRSHHAHQNERAVGQHRSDPWPTPYSADSSVPNRPGPQSDAQPIPGLPEAHGAAGYQSEFFLNLWDQPTQVPPSEMAQQDFRAASLLCSVDRGAVSTYQVATSEERICGTVSRAPVVELDDPGFLSRRALRGSVHLASGLGEADIQGSDQIQHAHCTLDQSHPHHADATLPSLPQSPRTDTYGGIGSFRLPPEFNSFSPGMMNYMDFDNPLTPFSSRPANNIPGSSKVLFSGEQLQQIRWLWHGQRSAPSVQLIRSLWTTAAKHSADNIFSIISDPVPSSRERDTSSGRWQIDEQCRRGLMDFCTELDERIRREDGADLMSQSAPSRSPASTSDASSLPGLSVDGFPTLEGLEASLDFYFQYFPFAFVHKATFDARTTHRSVLFPMCLIGLASLYAERSKIFVVRYMKKLMRFCRAELTSKALGHSEPWALLITITSTLLVTYLALGFLEEVGHSQAHMLCSQMLHVAEKHGLFATKLGENIALLLQSLPVKTKTFWKAWARVESSKRVILYLLLIDSAYTRLQGAAGVVDIDKVEIPMPCEAALFEAPTLLRFHEASERGTSLVMPVLGLHDLQPTAPATADALSLQTILTMFYLRLSAARHRLPIGEDMGIAPQSSSPAEAFTREKSAEMVLKSIMLLPSLYPKQLQGGDIMCALAWNNLGLTLTVDMDLLEIASGRKGLEAAQKATETVARWSSSASARRSILHAAQIFSVLSASRLRESNIARSDLLLFTSALVLSMYLFVVDSKTQHRGTKPLELLEEVDWAGLGSEGILPPQVSSTSQANEQLSNNAALRFVRDGGAVSFAGEALDGGTNTARKILTNYVHLLDELGKWRGSRCSQLLRTMSDFAIEGTVGNG